jgi:hypothetical protein
MTLYHLRSLRPSGNVAAVQRFSALSDEEALSIAREMVKAAVEPDFELWHRRRCVHATTLEKEKRSRAANRQMK